MSTHPSFNTADVAAAPPARARDERPLDPSGAPANTNAIAPPEGDWYFRAFEDRRPAEPVPQSELRDFMYQAFATCAIGLGGFYLVWRWTASLNLDHWWFSVPLVVAETLAFGGSILFFLSIWRGRDTARPELPKTVNDTLAAPLDLDRPLVVDVFFPTYNEETELVRLSIRDAKRISYPHAIDLRVHVLDDGKRPAMKKAAEEEGVNYITRQNNLGFKAGNLRNAMEQTGGDLIVICDADTRPFPNLLEETLGYFRDPTVAWVQTPQWFFDTEPGRRLPDSLALRGGRFGDWLGRAIERIVGPVTVGDDPLGNDPQMFYDVIQRRRNWCNGAFCCGAGSIHRREAVMEAALKSFAAKIDTEILPFERQVADPEFRSALASAMAAEAAREIELTPYKFHVSEDIYTSIVLHGDADRRWKSVYHPRVVTKMLSPQDLLAWSIQRFKYAGGTLDIFRNDNPLQRFALSSWQKVTYGSTIYSYLAPFWTVIFLLAPLTYFFTGWVPVRAYNAEFYAHLLPFLFFNKLAFMTGTWGVNTRRSEQYYLAYFWLNIKAIRDVILGKPIKFNVTPKTKQAGNYLSLVMPHITILVLSALGVLWMGARMYFSGRGEPSAYVANVFWAINNALSLSIIVDAAGRKASS